MVPLDPHRPGRAARLSVRAISEELAARFDPVARQLLPAGHYGPGRRTYRCGSVHGEPGQSLCVWLDGPRRGRWRDYAAGDHGDALDLIARVLFRGDLAAAIGWARDWLGLGRLDQADVERLDQQAKAVVAERRREANRAIILQQSRDAKAVWLAGTPLSRGDPAWLYFLERGIDLDQLPSPPRALRMHPGLYNAESRRPWPAIAAAISGPDGEHLNTHRIWLEVLGNGRVRKAPLQNPKMSMPGGYSGGCVRLWRGASGKPLRAALPGERVIISEGIEDGLSCVVAVPARRVIAAVSLGNMANIILPPAVEEVVIAAQNDPWWDDRIKGPHPAQRGLGRAIRALSSQGKRVFIARPAHGKDVNDLLQGGYS